MLFATWSLAFWLVRAHPEARPARSRTASRCSPSSGSAIVTKATSYALVPAALLVLVVGYVRLRRAAAAGLRGWPSPRRSSCWPLIVGAWLGTARALDRPAVNQIATGTAHPTPTLTSFNPREARQLHVAVLPAAAVRSSSGSAACPTCPCTTSG